MLEDRIVINQTIGISKDTIFDRKHNLWIGVSYSNNFYTESNIETLILFAKKYTKDQVLIWLPGRMQATNYRYFDDAKRAEALKLAYQDENKTRTFLQNFISKKVIIADYDETQDSTHVKNKAILYREFSKEGVLYNDVLLVVKNIIVARGRTPHKNKLESLALYILHELPLFLNGVSHDGGKTFFTCMLYPGMGALDELVKMIKEDKKYEVLRENLIIENKTGIADIKLNL